MASAGIGSPGHVAGELFKMMAGVDLVQVPYRGSAPALTDLFSGQVQVMFNPVQEFIEHIKTGRLRSLAVTTETRQAVLPDTPTVGEFVQGYAASGWAGIGAPRNTPVEIIERLNGAIGLADPRIVGRLVDSGVAPMSMTPSEFKKFVVEETEKWGKVIKFAGIKAE